MAEREKPMINKSTGGKEVNPAFQSNSFELGIWDLEFILNFGF